MRLINDPAFIRGWRLFKTRRLSFAFIRSFTVKLGLVLCLTSSSSSWTSVVRILGTALISAEAKTEILYRRSYIRDSIYSYAYIGSLAIYRISG